jgi:hypothetical protein
MGKILKMFPLSRGAHSKRLFLFKGCFKLEHFEATHVLTSPMPDLYNLPRECKYLPESSAFVLMLQKMVTLIKNLATLLLNVPHCNILIF